MHTELEGSEMAMHLYKDVLIKNESVLKLTYLLTFYEALGMT